MLILENGFHVFRETLTKIEILETDLSSQISRLAGEYLPSQPYVTFAVQYRAFKFQLPDNDIPR